MLVRIPRVLVLPLLAIGGAVWAVKGIASVTAKPTVAVFAERDELTVEVLNGTKVESTRKVAAGRSAVIEVGRGERTIRSTGPDGSKHEVTGQFGLGETYAAPTSADQCFALVDISGWYGYGRSSAAGAARVQKRETTSAVLTLPEDTYTPGAQPGTIEKKVVPKLVTPFSCAKMSSARDVDILDGIKPPSLAAAYGNVFSADEKRELADLGVTTLKKAVADKHPDWTLAHESKDLLVWKDGSGDPIFLDGREIPTLAGELGRRGGGGGDLFGKVLALATRVDRASGPGLYGKSDLLPSLQRTAEDGFTIAGDLRVGYVLRKKDATAADLGVDTAVLAKLAIDPAAIARANAEERYADQATDCLANVARSKEAVACGDGATSGACILTLIAASADPKAKSKAKPPAVWIRADALGLTLVKATKKEKDRSWFSGAASTRFLGTFDGKSLQSGLR